MKYNSQMGLLRGLSVLSPQIIPKQSAWLLHPMPNAEKEKEKEKNK